MKIFRSIVTIITLLIIPAGSMDAAGVNNMGKTISAGKRQPLFTKSKERSHYLKDRIIVKLGATPETQGSKLFESTPGFQKMSSKFGINSSDNIFSGVSRSKKGVPVDLSRYLVLTFTSPYEPFTVAEEMSNLPGVEYAEPWFIYPVTDIQACRPNDSFRPGQWALNKVLADSAWCYQQGDTSVVIGIIDTGVEMTHSDLLTNIWINYGEWGDDGLGGLKETNAMDDDGNGKIDDWRGWDFGGGNYSWPLEDNTPMPISESSTHGTHVAGIASAATNNGLGISGMGYKCRIMAVKASSDNDTRGDGFPYIVFGFEGIVYAAVNGADIISLSWGGDGASQFEQEVIDFALSHGSLVVAAAGNTWDNSIQYPASYDGVISVSGTLNDDRRAIYSTYNEHVDVSAPSDAIYSTYFGNTYQNMSGTSMATPLVAGLAGLVKAQFPSYSPLQVGEQLRVTCDNINAVNPSYVDLLGKGRINAVNAVTQYVPSLRMVDYYTDDSIGGNNNKILQPGETFSIVITLLNYLSPTTPGATVTLTESDSYLTVVNGAFPVGSVNTMASADNVASPFRVSIAANTPQAHIARLKLTIADGIYTDYQYFWITINPTYATHDVNNVQVSLTNISRLGFVDLNNTSGVGFVYNGQNQLYEGGLIIGYSATKLVDVVRNDTCATCQNKDFSSDNVFSMTYPGIVSAQDGYASFSDSSANPTNKVGISVDMYSYAYTTPDDSNYVLLRYDITNKSGGAISDLYVGLFMDWDITGNQADYYLFNRTTYQPDMDMGYAWNSGYAPTVYCGARVLDGAGGYRALINNSSITLSRSSKWGWLSGGYLTIDSVQDIHFAISSLPISLQDGEKKMVGFALLGGKNVDELWAASEAAKIKWTALKKFLGVSTAMDNLPAKNALSQNYPNPFNPSTTIGYAVAEAARVSLKIYDLLGREIKTMVDKYQAPGRYEVQFDGSGMASGIYYYRLNAGNYVEMKKFTLTK